MSASVGAMLLEEVRGPEPTVSAQAFVEAMGGTRAVAELIVATPALWHRGRRPKLASAMRRAQRWITEAGEQRHGGFERLKAAAPDAVRRAATDAWAAQEARRWGELEANGARTRMIGAQITDETPQPGKRPRTRIRTVPAQGTPGKYLPADVVRALRTFLQQRPPDTARAGELYVAAFFTQGDDYVWDFEPEVDELEALTIWPEGTEEGTW